MMHLTLKAKLVAFGALALATLLSVAAGNHVVTASLRGAFAEYSRGAEAVQKQIEADQSHDAIRGDVYAALAAAHAGQAQAVRAAAEDLKAHTKALTTAVDALEKADLGPALKQALAQVHQEIGPYVDSAQVVVAAAAMDAAGAQAGLERFAQRFKGLETAMAKSTELIDNAATAAMKHSDDAAQSSAIVLSVVALAAAALLVLVCYLFGRSILRQVGGDPDYAARVAADIAKGDLTADVKTRKGDDSSLLYAMKCMRDQLTDIVSQIKSASGSIAVASREIAQGNADLSQRTEEQASSLEETASSMEELYSTVKQNAENAQQANGLAAGASSVALKGGEVVGQVVETMSSINASSKKIVDIISVIDGIAFQTNILALNAAVEAARAGEQGRGFAVVASEVRSLAQRSAGAAKEIKELITDSVSKVESGSRLVDQAGQTMGEIVASVKRVTDIMGEISAATLEQTSGIEQVNQTVTQMDQATQQNAALVEEAAAAAEAMQEQAQTLTQAVSVFKTAQNEPAYVAPTAEATRAAVTPLPKREATKAEPEWTAPVRTAKKIANGRAGEGE